MGSCWIWVVVETFWGSVPLMHFMRSSIPTTTCIAMNPQAGTWICWMVWVMLKIVRVSWIWLDQGIGLDILQSDHWVPGSTSRAENVKFQNKPLFKEILTTTPETCTLYANRATEDCGCLVSWRCLRIRYHLMSFVTLTDCQTLYVAGLCTKGVQRCDIKGQGQDIVWSCFFKFHSLWIWQLIALRKLRNVLKTSIFCCATFAVFGYGYVPRWRLSSQAMWWSGTMISSQKGFLNAMYGEDTSNEPRPDLEPIKKLNNPSLIGWLTPILNIQVWLVGSRQF